VDILFTVCVCVCMCVCVRLRISLLRINLAASNIAQQFLSVQGRESHIFVNFAPPGRIGQHAPPPRRSKRLPFGSRTHDSVDVKFVCVDIRFFSFAEWLGHGI